MSHAKRCMRGPSKKRQRPHWEPIKRRTAAPADAHGEIWLDAASAEGEEMAAALNAIFGPPEGRVVAVGMSGNLKH